MELNSLNAEEHECVKNCLFRYNATERVVLDKIRYVMGQWVNQDPSLRAAYMAQNKGKWSLFAIIYHLNKKSIT